MNEFENNNQQNDTNSGYTVTPNGGFYNENGDNDAPKPTSSQPVYTTPPVYVPPKSDNAVAAVKPKKEKRRHSTAVVVLACVLAAIIGAGSAIGVTSIILSKDDNESEASSNTSESQKTDKNASDDDTADLDDNSNNESSTPNIVIDESNHTIAEAVAIKCSDSVVGIRTTTSVSSFFGGSQEEIGSGSGVIYSANGYIITNYHVIKDALASKNSKIDVFIGNNQSDSYPATVIGYNISCDLAVIKIEADNLTPIEMGNSDTLNVGQYVITIGAPGGLEFMGSVTYGIISGLDRIVSADSKLKLIQTDAAINPGNSGGALLDAQGRLIGINSSKIAAVEFEGMGFAIPVNVAREKCDKIISRQGEEKAFLGVNISVSYTAEVLEYYGFPTGAVVGSVTEDSPAEKAGIQRGDIITKFNGIEIKEYSDLNDALYDCSPNDTVDITIYRNEKYYKLDITLASDTIN